MTQQETIKTALAGILTLALFWCPAGIHAQEEKTEPALGLSTDFGDVLIENLGIGRTYNLREIAGSPLKVKNNSSEVVNLKIDVTIPKEDMITRKRKNLGVEPIPTLAWITVSQNEFLVPPGETAFTDVIIDIPDDPSLYGRKFQASIHSHTRGNNFLQLGVWSHVVFTFVPSPEKQAEMEKNRSRGLQKRADFTLLPDKLYLEKVPVGKKYDVRKENRRTIKLANIGEDPVELAITTVWVKDSPLSLQSGFEEGNPGWFKAKKDKILLDIDSVEDPRWIVKIPKKSEFKNRKYMFVVKVEPTDPDVVSFTFYGQIYVETEE